MKSMAEKIKLGKFTIVTSLFIHLSACFYNLHINISRAAKQITSRNRPIQVCLIKLDMALLPSGLMIE